MDSGELKRRFGKHVKALREAKGLTQEQLADRIGRSVDTVSNIERGVNATRIEVAHLIATELGIGLPELFAFEGSLEKKVPTAASSTLVKLLEGCDERTADNLLELVRVGLRLAERT